MNPRPGRVVMVTTSGHGDRPVRWCSGFTLAALIGTAFLVDPFAEAAFDAPKRLAFALCAVFASAALLWLKQPWPRVISRPARWIAALAAASMVGIMVAALLAPQPEQTWAALRMIVFAQLYLLLGASRAFNDANGIRILLVAMLVVALSAALSLAQHVGFVLPLPTEHIAGRFDTGALLGNEGYVALAAALLGAAGAAIASNHRVARWRVLASLALLLALITVLANRQVTSLVALIAGAVTVLLVRMNARWAIGGIAVLMLVCASIAVVAPWRTALFGESQEIVDRWQSRTTFRVAAFAAAMHMIEQRPLLGHGPGSYALHSTEHRLAAEIEHRRRLLTPNNATAFTATHNEYLQLAAEAGVPVLVAVLSALALLLHGLVRTARAPGAVEPLLLLAVLVTGCTAALAWFPMQIPLTAILLLLALGRGWRMVAEAPEGSS